MTWQPAALVYPDAEALICNALASRLPQYGATGVHVDRERPQDSAAGRFVIVSRDGGATGVVRDQPRLRLRIFDQTPEAAADLAALVVALMPLLVRDGVLLRSEHLSGPYEVPDDGPLEQRYLLYEVHTRPTQQLA